MPEQHHEEHEGHEKTGKIEPYFVLFVSLRGEQSIIIRIAERSPFHLTAMQLFFTVTL